MELTGVGYTWGGGVASELAAARAASAQNLLFVQNLTSFVLGLQHLASNI